MDRRRNQDRSEINLLPMMNLVSLLIPMLLMGSQLVLLSSIEVKTPAMAPSATVAVPDDMRLVVRIEPEGYEIHGGESVYGEEVVALPCAGQCNGSADWPADQLTARLLEVKLTYPQLDTVIVIPDSTVAYQTIIKTLDASREHAVGGEKHELFPLVSIASR